MAHIVVTRPIIEDGLAGLEADHEVTVCEAPNGSDRSADDVIEMAGGAEALIPTVADPLPEAVFDACPSLEIVAQYGVGLDNVDLEAAKRHDVIVTHTPGVLTDATADFTWALLLAVARQVREADRYVREGRFQQWETTLLLGTELSGKTIGIVGLGRIGAAVARRALGFGMEVVYHSRTGANPTVERQTCATRVDLDTLLAESDVVSLHCPLNDDSHHLIDAAALQAMKPTAFLLNTARGPIVDEAALAGALADGEIAGAGLDVFEEEPDVHPDLLDRDRVVLAPHLASATTDARIRMGQMCVASLRAHFNHEDEIPHRAV